jgi:O-antigen ligase
LRRRREPGSLPHQTSGVAIPRRTDRAWSVGIATLLLIGAALVPICISRNGDDHFRLPKQIVLYGFAILAGTATAIGAVLGKLDLRRVSGNLRRISRVAAAGLAWVTITIVTSTNRELSVDAVIWGGLLLVVLLTSALSFRSIGVTAFTIALAIPAVLNATLLFLQAAEIWNPWSFPGGTPARAMNNALLGNPDDLGVYLAAPAIFAVALTIAIPRRRVLHAALAFYLTAALVVTETLTSLAAFTIALVLLAVSWNRRHALRLIGILFLSLIVIGLAYIPLRSRLREVARNVTAGQWDSAVSGRLIASVAAWEMYRDHPITGVGPGCFKFNYMPYRIEVERRHPHLVPLSGARMINFGETHNDHLQILAETGVPGWLAVMGGILLVGALSYTRFAGPIDERSRLARLLAMPFATSIVIMMLAQFPLQLAAPAYTFMVIAGACVAWSSDATV